MPDYFPGDMLLQYGRGSRGVESIRADAFRIELILSELQALQEENCTDTLSLTLQRCIEPPALPCSPSQFVLVAELFAVYSPIWQFAITWKAPVLNEKHGHETGLSQQYYVWRSDLSSWMTRIWLGDLCQRVPLNCFSQSGALTACIQHFLQTGGGRYPGLTWISDADMAWRFCVHPEDEYPNRHESQVRPKSTVSPPEMEVQRQLGQLSSRNYPAIKSLQLTDRPGVLLHDGSRSEVMPLNAATIAQVIDRLNRMVWQQTTCFISIYQQESRFSPLLGYVSMYGHPLGVLMELVISNTQSEDHYCSFSPMEFLQSEQMVRIWVGMHYRRVPVNCLVQPTHATPLVQALLSHPHLQSTLFPWHSEPDAWLTRISPEDDSYDPLEPPTRLASLTPVASKELYERLTASYTAAGLPTIAIRHS